MATQYFSVKEQLFDIQFTNRSLVHELQNRVSRITNDRLIPEMNTSFEKIVPENLIIRFNSLTLDIGDIDYDSLEEELVPKVIQALEDELSLQIRLLQENKHAASEGTISVQNIAGNEELLEYFLLNGTLPWWAQMNNGIGMDGIIRELFAQNPSGLRALIIRIGQSESVRKRLVFQFGEESIHKIIQVLEPSEAAYILGYHKEVVAIQQTEQIVQAETTSFAKAVWLFIITYLLEDRGSEFNRKAFVKSTLVQMAAWFNINYYELLKLFYEAVVISVEHDQHIVSLEIFIRELTIEETIYHESRLPDTRFALPESVPSKNAEQLSRKADIVLYYLAHGSLPAGANSYSNQLLAEMLYELMLHIPGTMRSLLRSMVHDSDTAKRYYELTGQQRGRELLQKLYPGTARLLIMFSSLIELIQEKKQLLGMGVSGLEQVLPGILVQLLFSEGEKQDAINLLDDFAKQLALRFDKDKQELIRGLDAAVQEEFRQGIRNSNLPELINTLSGKVVASTKENITADEKKITDKSIIVEDKTGLTDTLIFLVQYGYIPWWGKRFFEKETVAGLFHKLLQSSPGEMLQLLRIAGNEPHLQKRLLSFVSLPTLLDSIILLPMGERAINAINQATHWFEKGIGVMEGVDSVIRKIIFHSAWDEMINATHQSFSATGFYTRTVLRLATHLNTTAEIVVNTFTKGLAMQTDSTLYQAEQEILDTIIHLLDMEMAPVVETKPVTRKSTDHIVESLSTDPFIQKVLTRLTDEESRRVLAIISAKRHPRRPITTMQVIQRSSPYVKQEAIKEAQDILRYFLVWKRLPDEIRIGEYRSVDAFIKQLILLVYSIDQTALSSLVQEEQYIRSASYAFNKLFDVYKGGDEKRLSILFDGLLTEKAAVKEPVAAGISVEQNLKEAIEETAVKDMIAATLPSTQKINRELLTSEAAKIIEYFFEWNRLPDQWQEQSNLSMPVILRQLLMILYKENTVLIQRLLQNQAHAVSPRVYFHELVSVTEGGIEKELALFMQPYKEMYLQKQFALSKQAKIIQIEKQAGDDYTKTRTGEITTMTIPQLVEWIDHFLSGTALPKGASEPVAVTDEKLVKTVIQLYSLDQQVLKQVLAKEDHLVSARIRLHDLFITHTGYQERAVLQLLQQYWQKDLLALLSSKDVDIDGNKPIDLAKILLHFLESGKRTQKETDLWQLAITSPLFIRYLTIDAGPQVLKTFVEKTAIGWGEEVVDYMEAMRRLIEASVPNNLERDKLLALLLQFNLLFLSGRLSIRSREDYLQAFFSYISQATHTILVTVFVGMLQFIRQKNISSTNILAGSIDVLQTELQELLYRLDHRLLQKKEWQGNEEKAVDEEKERKRLQQLEAIRAELEKERLLEEERRRKESEKSEEEKPNKIYIRNAGMVLLHPFLGIYFSKLGLTEQGKFVNEVSQQRAVLLLQYLVNGRNISEEFELALNKILCGLDIDAAVPLEIELTEAEITVSAELFQVIFQRWEKMKNTSVEGFRASFLQREGALSRGQESWELRVEQRTYDMLLETLPWSFGMIKNTWMNQLLTVEWI